MPHYLVEIRGNAHRAMGLLAKSGIQNLPVPLEEDRVIARLSSETPENAHSRVLAALGEEPFTVEDVHLED